MKEEKSMNPGRKPEPLIIDIAVALVVDRTTAICNTEKKIAKAPKSDICRKINR
tara:strand:- start:991 stop:1152 length:162 start_codon:yes stop_codon:yes gene_type:complete